MTKKNSRNKMPAIMFYTGDWLKDPAVRCLSLEARGLWIDMLCLMYESPVRGFLSVGAGTPVTATLLARMVGADKKQVQTLLDELNACGVFSVDESGVMFSRRMVADEKLRDAKSKAGKKGMKERYNSPAKSDDIDKDEVCYNKTVTDPITEGQQSANRVSNRGLTALEYEYEYETAIDSSNNFHLSRNARQNNSIVDFVLNAIPKNRLHNPIKTKVQILRVLDVAIKKGQDEVRCAELLATRFRMYYDSEEGKGEYFKTPHKWLEEDCHLVDPSVWDSRKKQKETTGWETIQTKGKE